MFKNNGVKMTKINKLFLSLFLLLGISVITFASGGNRTGTGGAAQLSIPVGARTIAMGGANIASAFGIEALYWNPAGVAKLDKSVGVTFSHMSYIADIGVEYGAVAANIEGFGVVSFSVKSLAIDDILVTTTQDPDGTGATFSPQMLVAGVSYSKLLTDNIAIGVTANYISETLGQVDATGLAFNVGVSYENLGDISGLNFAIAIKNLGGEMQYDGAGLLQEAEVEDFNRPPQLYQANSAPFEIPSQFEIGFAYAPKFDDVNSLQLSTSFQNNNFSGDEYKLGAEYAYDELLFIRGGYSFAPDVENEDYLYGLTAGVGLKYTLDDIDLMVDYAFRDVQYFDANHVFQISFGF
jgi:hypothetical protein